MKTGRNLQEVLVELDRQNKAKQDFISPAQGMRLWEDGHTFEINHLTTNQQEVFGTTSLFHRQVASALGIPAKYYDLMQAQKPELLAQNVNTWFADKPSAYMVRSMDYGNGQVARALLSERYRRIDNMEIATAVLPLFAGNDQYEVMSCEVTENRLYLKVVNHRLEMEVSKGDIVQAGVMISNSEVGLGAVSIQPLVYRLVCTNGKGVTRVDDPKDLKKSIQYALSYSHSDEFIIEDFITQHGYSSDTDSFSIDGDLKFVSFDCQRFDREAKNPYTPAAYSWPSSMTAEHQEELKNEIQRLLKLLKMRTAVYNIETREGTDGKAYIKITTFLRKV